MITYKVKYLYDFHLQIKMGIGSLSLPYNVLYNFSIANFSEYILNKSENATPELFASYTKWYKPVKQMNVYLNV